MHEPGSNVIRLHLELDDSWTNGSIHLPTGLSSSTFAGDGDIQPWLDLQNLAFLDQGRRYPWHRRKFEHELRGRDWWAPEFLVVISERERRHPFLGAVALETCQERRFGVVHWLAVHPAHRRRGIANYLVRRLAALSQSAGLRWLRAETLVHWTSAVQFYEQIGFRRCPV